MGLFNQFFGKKKIEKKGKDSRYLPEEKEPIHIEFAQNYIARGGKFIYCENSRFTRYYFESILNENNWTEDDIIAQNEVLASFFSLNENVSHPKAMILRCEYLIANKGAILICNRQIQEQKLSDLPDNLIIVASTNDFKADVSEAMTAINQKYKNRLPTNITTLNAFDPTKENDFLSYGGSSKHLYLLIQEVNE
ncbi:MAG: LUD domain-containing protein [Flavobacteriaceae bacterium]